MIAVLILAVMSIFSQDVRTALFGMKYIEQQLYDLKFRLRESEERAEQTQADLVEASTNLELTGFELDSMKKDKLVLEQEKNEFILNTAYRSFSHYARRIRAAQERSEIHAK